MSSSDRALRLGMRIQAFMAMAEATAELGTCMREKVGCVVTDWRMAKVHAFGYNGPVRGDPNDSCANTGPCPDCGRGSCGCAHAEANAITKLSPRDVRDEKGIVIVTRAPCIDCARLIVNAYCIECVVYKAPYRNDLGLERLQQSGITTIHARDGMSPAYIGIALIRAELG